MIKRISRNKIKRECWNLDYSLICWLNDHFKVFLKDAEKHIDLDFHKFVYKRKGYTQREIIERIIDITYVLKDEDIYYSWEQETYENNNILIGEMYNLLKLVHRTMWW